MSRFAARFIEQSVHRGEARVLLRKLTTRFGQLSAETLSTIEAADADTILKWTERVPEASTLDEVMP